MPAGYKRATLLLAVACFLLVGLFTTAIWMLQPSPNRLKVQQQVKAYSQANSPVAREQALAAIQGMGSDAAPYLVEIIEYRESALDGWRYELKQRYPALLQQGIESPETIAGWRKHAAKLISTLKDKQQAIALLVPLLKDDRPQVRFYALKPLSSLIQGTESDLLPVLLKHMENPIDQSNGLTPVIVAKFCDGHPEATRALESLLGHPEEKVRLQVASLLWTSERENLLARKAVEQSLESADLLQRLFAARIYYSRTQDAAKVIPLYSKALTSPNWLDQSVALTSLKEMGAEAQPVAEEVEPFLSASNQVLSNSAWQVLEAVREK